MQTLSAAKSAVASHHDDADGAQDSAPASPIIAPSRRVGYIYNWDRLRLLAAIDPMAMHVLDRHVLMGTGLPLFLVLSVALSVIKPEPPPSKRFVMRRVERIVIPWVFWSVIFGLMRGYYQSKTPNPPFAWFQWEMLLYGPRQHLWFLPFIACFGIVAHVVHKATFRINPRVVCIASIILAVLFAWIPTQMILPWPYRQWVFALPTLPLGLAVGRMLSFQPSMWSLRWWSLLLSALYVSLGLVMYVYIEPVTQVYLVRFGGALLILSAVTWLPNVLDRWTAKITPIMLGLYMLHPYIYWRMVKPFLIKHGLIDIEWVALGATFLTTAACVALLRLTPIRRFL